MNVKPQPSRFVLALLVGVLVACGLAAIGIALAYTFRPTSTVPSSPTPAATQAPMRPATIPIAATAMRSPVTRRSPLSLPTMTTTPASSPGRNMSTDISHPTTTRLALTPLATNCPCDRGDVLNCSDFHSQVEAQTCFLACGGLDHDVHKLDRDRDGIACEDSRY